MELNKINSTSLNQDAAYVAPNQKIECKDGQCYLVDIKDTDEEATVILKDEQIETQKEETTKETKQEAGEIITLNKKSFKDIRNQSGTTFVIVGGTSCSRCKKLDKNLDKINDAIGGNATITTLTLPDKATTSDEFYKIYRELKEESGEKEGRHGYPIIIKLVDGVATEFYDYSDCGNVYTDAEKMSNWLEKKIEGEKGSSIKIEKSQDSQETEQTDKTEAQDTKEETDVEDKKWKTSSYIENLLGLKNDTNSDYAKEYIISEIKNARSIMDLKKMLFNLNGLDINTQLDVMDAINEIKFDDDLSAAKSSVLLKLC